MEQVPRIETERLLLTLPSGEVTPRFTAYAIENEPHLARWEAPRPDGYFTHAFWQRRIERARDDYRRDIAIRLAIFHRSDPQGPLLGQLNLNQIVRGAFLAATLGYSIDHRVEGTGMMTEALRAVIPFAFNELGLHRLMANYIPTNERSGRLLRRLSFVVEGYARDYLFIGGAWRDHILTALTNPGPLPPSV